MHHLYGGQKVEIESTYQAPTPCLWISLVLQADWSGSELCWDDAEVTNNSNLTARVLPCLRRPSLKRSLGFL